MMGLVHVRFMGLVLVAVDSMHDVQSLNTDAQYSGFPGAPFPLPPPPMMDHGRWPQKKFPATLVIMFTKSFQFDRSRLKSW